MVPNIPPQEASNRLQIFQVKLPFLYVDNVLLFFKVILVKINVFYLTVEKLVFKVHIDFNCILIC